MGKKLSGGDKVRKGITKILDWILDFENWLFGEGIPDEWDAVDNTFVVEKLIEAYPYAKIYIADAVYYVCSRETIEEFLASDPTDQERYVTETYDCDDFSFRLMGQFHEKPYAALAFGIAWSRVHGYNIFVSKEGEVLLIEPQTDEILKPSKDEVYNTELIIM